MQISNMLGLWQATGAQASLPQLVSKVSELGGPSCCERAGYGRGTHDVCARRDSKSQWSQMQSRLLLPVWASSLVNMMLRALLNPHMFVSPHGFEVLLCYGEWP